MDHQQRHVPLDYAKLLRSIHGGEYPAERHWLDFKRELYPRPAASGTPRKPKSNREVHEELARDLASLAVRGGYLVFGVEEDKAAHTFTVVDMPLPAHLDQTIDQVARDFIDPPLLVAPTLLANPGGHGSGMMVVEVPESPDAPHMAGGTYYGRTETGKVKLTDDEIERLILRRGRAGQRLLTAMADTLSADPESHATAAHFYLTAVPTQAPPDMLLQYTRDTSAHNRFLTTANEWNNDIGRADAGVRDPIVPIAFDRLLYPRRGQRPRGAWFCNYPQGQPVENPGFRGRALILDDDGIVRFIDLMAGPSPDGPGSVVHDGPLWWETLDLVRLIGRLAQSRGYYGGWLLGAELTRMRGRTSSIWGGSRCEADQLTATSRAATRQILDRPREAAAGLLRPLFRDIGSEKALDQMAASPSDG